jgi:hypothetical protein
VALKKKKSETMLVWLSKIVSSLHLYEDAEAGKGQSKANSCQ